MTVNRDGTAKIDRITTADLMLLSTIAGEAAQWTAAKVSRDDLHGVDAAAVLAQADARARLSAVLRDASRSGRTAEVSSSLTDPERLFRPACPSPAGMPDRAL